MDQTTKHSVSSYDITIHRPTYTDKSGRAMNKTVANVSESSVIVNDLVSHRGDEDEQAVRNADEALKALEGVSDADLAIDSDKHAKLLRTIDLYMMPVRSAHNEPGILIADFLQIMCIVYCLNFLDKTTLNYAAVMGISKPRSEGGLGLHGDEYNWLARHDESPIILS